MKTIIKNIKFILILLIFIGCKDKIQLKNKKSEQKITNDIKTDSNSFKVEESKNQTDNPVNEYLIEKLKPIRNNFKRINSIKTEYWSKIETKFLEGTIEGGEATYYYLNAELTKITTKEFGETFQILTEYYFLNKNLSFVFEKNLKYNRPIYHDKKAMKEMGDTEVFDFDKSEIVEYRNYFENGKLLHQLSSEDCGAPMANDYIEIEQKRILNNFDIVIKLKNEK